MSKARLALAVTFMLSLLAAVAPAGAQTLFERQQRQYEERMRTQLDYSPPAEERFGVDWGGWFNYSFALYEDVGDPERQLNRYDLYLWGRTVVQGAHEFYARMRLSFLDWNNSDSPDGNEQDWEGPYVDRLYYVFDLREATRRREKRSLPYNARVKVGRQYVEFGSGLALSLPLDAVVLTGEAANVEVTGLIGRTIGSWDNFDRSAPVSASSNRDFYGVQVTYHGLNGRHVPYAYYVWQQDHTAEDPSDGSQNYRYDSEYLGFGSRGRLIWRDLYYQTELVFERGRSHGVSYSPGSRSFSRTNADPDHIHAMAFDVLLRYLFRDEHEPTLTFEYLYASGDDDRLGSPTDTLGGNAIGTTDHGFNGFGYRNTGQVYAPPVSNLHMLRLGGTVRPMPNHRWFERLVAGCDLFFYLKDESRGSGIDAPSTGTSSELGQALDLYVNWRLTNDLLWTVRYGVFWPGDSYTGTRSSRNLLFTGVTVSF